MSDLANATLTCHTIMMKEVSIAAQCVHIVLLGVLASCLVAQTRYAVMALRWQSAKRKHAGEKSHVRYPTIGPRGRDCQPAADSDMEVLDIFSRLVISHSKGVCLLLKGLRFAIII